MKFQIIDTNSLKRVGRRTYYQTASGATTAMAGLKAAMPERKLAVVPVEEK